MLSVRERQLSLVGSAARKSRPDYRGPTLWGLRHLPWTCSVQKLLRVIGEAMGGRAGARLSQQLAMQCSPTTIFRLVRKAPLPSFSAVRVVGVDEWAWRKGQSYGTILVDLEQRKPIDLLADATAASFAAWLAEHPCVELISRDRGTTFADGATRGAPGASDC